MLIYGKLRHSGNKVKIIQKRLCFLEKIAQNFTASFKIRSIICFEMILSLRSFFQQVSDCCVAIIAGESQSVVPVNIFH